MITNFEKVNQLLLQDEFVEKLKTKEDDAAVKELFAEYDVSLSLEDIEKMTRDVCRIHGTEEKELSSDELEGVAGGVVFMWLAGASIAFYASYGYRSTKAAYKNLKSAIKNNKK